VRSSVIINLEHIKHRLLPSVSIAAGACNTTNATTHSRYQAEIDVEDKSVWKRLFTA